jgi:hypothetical protein
MVVASDLLFPWRRGTLYTREELVQWILPCGLD